jgi:hypothetical protein
MSLDMSDMPDIVAGALVPMDIAALAGPNSPTHAPRILLLYGRWDAKRGTLTPLACLCLMMRMPITPKLRSYAH